MLPTQDVYSEMHLQTLEAGVQNQYLIVQASIQKITVQVSLYTSCIIFITFKFGCSSIKMTTKSKTL